MTDASLTGLDIVIPNWNGREMLKICLSSLAAQSYTNFSVIVVDNGSTDGSVEFLQADYPDVKLVKLPENRGFSAAVNTGIKSGNRDWVLLLNNDIEVDPRCLENLVAQCTLEPRVKMFALKMVSFHDRSILDGAGDGVLRGGVGYRLGTMEPDSQRYNLKRKVFGACAGAALYHRSLFAEIGYFDEEFFAYLEDVDLNMRAVRAGHSCCYVPEAVVYHVGSASTGSKINKLTVRLTTRNNIYVISKNYSFGTFLRFLPALLIYQFFWFLFVVKKGQFIAYMSGLMQAVSRSVQMCLNRSRRDAAQALPEDEFRRKIVDSEKEVINSIMSRRSGEGKNNIVFRWYLSIFC